MPVILDGSYRLQFRMLHINTCISLWTVRNCSLQLPYGIIDTYHIRHHSVWECSVHFGHSKHHTNCGGLVGHLQSMILRLISYCPMVLLSYVLWSYCRMSYDPRVLCPMVICPMVLCPMVYCLMSYGPRVLCPMVILSYAYCLTSYGHSLA